jgi:hypothetical protein
MTKDANQIAWTRHPLPAKRPAGTVLYSAEGPFEWAGSGRFVITIGSTIGKPYCLRFQQQPNAESFLGAFQTVSGAKAAAKRFGTWSN